MSGFNIARVCNAFAENLSDGGARESGMSWESAGEFVDAGFSGAKASRPALDKLMAAAGRREFDCILVWKIDRFGRSVLHLSQQLAALTSYGVRFIAVSQGLDTDASNPSSRLMLTILAGVAEFERGDYPGAHPSWRPRRSGRWQTLRKATARLPPRQSDGYASRWNELSSDRTRTGGICSNRSFGMFGVRKVYPSSGGISEARSRHFNRRISVRKRVAF